MYGFVTIGTLTYCESLFYLFGNRHIREIYIINIRGKLTPYGRYIPDKAAFYMPHDIDVKQICRIVFDVGWLPE